MHLRGPDESVRFGVETIEPYVATARGRGVDEIGFTEHVYYFRQTRELWSLDYQLERCVYDLDELLAPYPWDYVLGSVHWIDGLAVDLEPGLWAEHSVEAVWRRYFRELE